MKDNKNKAIAIIIIVLVVLIGLWLWNSKKNVYAPSPTGQVTPPIDDNAQITQDLDSIDLGDLEGDFQAIDQDLNSLENPSGK